MCECGSQRPAELSPRLAPEWERPLLPFAPSLPLGRRESAGKRDPSGAVSACLRAIRSGRRRKMGGKVGKLDRNTGGLSSA